MTEWMSNDFNATFMIICEYGEALIWSDKNFQEMFSTTKT